MTILICILSCESKKTVKIAEKALTEKKTLRYELSLRHAKNLKIDYQNDFISVTVAQPYKGSNEGLTYFLVSKNDPIPDILKGEKVIQIPIESFVCTSTTHLPPLDMLNEENKLVGFPTLSLVSSEKIQERARKGLIAELGNDYSLNTEKVMELSPELLMAFTLDGNYKHLAPAEKAGIKTMVNADYLENSPLGRAEWIKLFGVLFNKEKKADSIFSQIEANYNQTLDKVKKANQSPTSFCGTPYKGVWYMPGGNSWMGKFLKDAHSDYLWSESTQTGSMELSFESVYDRAYNADIWINATSSGSLAQLGENDERYKGFKAFKSGAIYNSDAKVTAAGGNDYYESGYSRPDIVLNDLVKIFHPGLVPDYELYYFKQLK